MSGRLRLPAVLAVVVVTTGATIALTTSCGDDAPPQPDAACQAYCTDTSGGSNCPFPTCATGPDYETCPPGCDVI